MTATLRIHAGTEPGPRPGGEFVLYWMQNVTLRISENFALGFAIEQANQLRLPLLIYHGLRPDYPWASDRIHTFVLESVVDLAEDFEARGIQYAFDLDQRSKQAREDHGASRARSPLRVLAERAALVVTDFFPTFIIPRQTRALRRKVEPPVIAVDSATIVPMRFHDREHVTARGIRPILMNALPHYLFRFDPPEPKIRSKVALPFQPTHVEPSRIATLVSGCDIDHSVPPSPTIRGGSRAARTRLEEFVSRGLHRYDADRSDPNADGSSRLSPYLHFGNVSAHEVLLSARAQDAGQNYGKFLDQIVTWRELSHNFVFKNRGHRTLDAVPAWARKELEDHSSDPRPVFYTDGELELAQTHDDLWNACQVSLLRDGELHNYLRMLWGKSVLLWTKSPADALRILEHLNHKYALDGRDPNSYGGILWCFGKFDRPFYRRPIFGLVRYQSLTTQKKRFDVDLYVKTRRPPVVQAAKLPLFAPNVHQNG
ncbi:MAG: deoxyribodipyrimidine photo-lyase [Gemmatimonadota bacterium]